MQLLLAKGADVNAKNNAGSTALMAASEKGHKEVVELLLAKGADVNAKANAGWTALMYASQNGDKEVVELLLAKGADVNAKNNHGGTAWMVASSHGHKEIAELIRVKGANVNALMQDEINAKGDLINAAGEGDLSSVKALLDDKADVNAKNNHGGTALMAASSHGHKEIVELLLAKGADVNYKTDRGYTALTSASYNGHKEVVELLLDKGAVNRGAALVIASQNGHKEVVELLLAKGADVNATASAYFGIKNGTTAFMNALPIEDKGATWSKFGATALIFSSHNGYLDVVQLLLDKGANVNATMSNGATALIYASQNGHKEVVQALIDKGSDLNHKMSDGSTALMLACERGYVETVIFLYQMGADTTVPEDKIEINGRLQHLLGDYFLAIDQYDKARNSYQKAQDFYTQTAKAYKGDVTKIAWAQVGSMVGRVVLEGVIGAADAVAMQGYQPNVNTKLNTQILAMKYAQKTNTGVKGYQNYMDNYKSTYISTFATTNTSYSYIQLPSANASLDTKKSFAQMNAKRYDELSMLMHTVLECFNSGLSGVELRSCVEEKAKGQKN